MPPTLLAAVGMSLRAVTRSPALLAGGLGVALLSRLLAWPAFAAGVALVVEAAAFAARASPLDPVAPFAAVASLVGSGRFLAVVGGLYLAALVARGLLRVAWLAGALPQLAGEMAGAPGPRFATGVAFGFARVLPAAALGLVADASAAGFSLALLLAAARVVGDAASSGAPAWLAAATALAFVLALAVPLAMSAWVDAAVARAALRGEGAGVAFAGATRRFLARPGTFVLASLAFALAGAVGPATVQGLSGLATGFAPGADPLVLAGPSTMMSVLAMFVAAVLDLTWLGAVAALACAGEAEPQRSAISANTTTLPVRSR